MAGEPGFEPGPTESESAVLPLYYSPKVRFILELRLAGNCRYFSLPFETIYQGHTPFGKTFFSNCKN